MSKIWLSQLEPVRPRFESTQEESVRWLAEAHAEAATMTGRDLTPARCEALIRRFGCKPEQLARRGHEPYDFRHRNNERMEIYDLQQHGPAGAPLATRMAAYEKGAHRVFAELYDEATEAPAELFHVTCTGYASPSVAQQTAVARGWSRQTRVTHLYHMGCYAALPAVRTAAGALHANPDDPRPVDVVHTEMCSLHLDPSDHRPEQLVVQSLFADGNIRYSLQRSDMLPTESPAAFEVIASHEEQVPDSAEDMGWTLTERGFAMSLARRVPTRIADRLEGALETLAGDHDIASAIYAVHPGGPRIIDGVSERLGLAESQVAHARGVLHDHGNMSSATLPHIWHRLTNDDAVPSGSLVVSLAFGPGLSICANLMRLHRP